jgi:uncharacterized membrane protein
VTVVHPAYKQMAARARRIPNPGSPPARAGVTGPKPPHWSRHVDPWYWYTERLPASLSLLLPLLLALAPLVLARLLDAALVAPVWQLELLALVGLQLAIPFGIFQHLAPWFILAIVLWIQFLLLVWLVRNIEILRQWGRVDRFFRRQEEKAARAYERHHWLRRFHFVGLVFFIFLPVGSGLVTGVFVGKLTGMTDRRLVASIFLGTLLWAVLFVWIGDVVGDAVRRLA